MHNPLVSVIMSAFNAEAFIEEAIYSILNQTYKNLELIIVNDGSTDRTADIIQKFKDSRIVFLQNNENKGNIFSRNLAIAEAKGEFIAILDSDDVALPNRLETQVNHFLQHDDMDLLGGGMISFGLGDEKTITFPTDYSYIQAFLLFKNCIAQPTIMFRLESLKKYYPLYQNHIYGPEDYETWFRLSKQKIRFANLKIPLIKYRLSTDQISERNKAKLQERQRQLFVERIQTLGINLRKTDVEIIHRFIESRIEINDADFKLIKHFLDHAYMANRKLKIYKQTYFKAVLYFFYLRLGKYYFLQYKKKPLQFLNYFAAVVYMQGLKSFYIFNRNEKIF
ncbi:MAG: glycosyltransferase family 2 protein [Sphingobacteriales bacterium]|nr:MAG: glycosyltransferase family 2 protein [Sphingobacteriales bacterium]